MNPLEAFETLDLRVGRIVRAEPNERARKPAYKLWIDFGPLGQKTSSAQLTTLYRPEELVGRLVIAAMNLGTRNIAGFESEVLVLGSAECRGRGGSAGGGAGGAGGGEGLLTVKSKNVTSTLHCFAESATAGLTTNPVTAPSLARLHSMSMGWRARLNDAFRV